MNLSIDHLSLLSLSVFFGLVMLLEGSLIVLLHKTIIPLPTKILYWVSVGLIGKQKSNSKFTGKNTPENLRTYAVFTLTGGAAVLIASLFYLNWILTR
jgi:hypothetical protein